MKLHFSATLDFVNHILLCALNRDVTASWVIQINAPYSKMIQKERKNKREVLGKTYVRTITHQVVRISKQTSINLE